MNYYQLKEDNLYLSKELCQYPVLSGQIFIFAAIIGCFFKFYYLSFTMFCLYVSTMLFWSNHHDSNSTEFRIIDGFLGTLTAVLAIYYGETHVLPKYRYILYSGFAIGLAFYILNEFLYYMLADNHSEFSKVINVENRGFLNRVSVFLHICFLHIMPVFVFFSCVMMSI